MSGLVTSVHLLSLDALLAVIDSIEGHCHHRILHTASQMAADQAKHKSGFYDVHSPTRRDASPVTQLAGASRGATPVTSKPRTVTSPKIKPNRMKVSDELPSDEELLKWRHKKKLYHHGTELFNVKPKDGIAFLQEHGLLAKPLDPVEVASFLRENPRLDKKQIGEYVSAKKNAAVFNAFFK